MDVLARAKELFVSIESEIANVINLKADYKDEIEIQPCDEDIYDFFFAENGIASIPILLRPSCPSAICFFIISSRVNPVKRHSVRPNSHVVYEAVQSSPLTAHLDSLPSVIRPAYVC
jgi:hypothetical protein